MADDEQTIFVVTAGVSIRGNLVKLRARYSVDQDERDGDFVTNWLSFIGSFPPRSEPIDKVADVVGLKRKSKQSLLDGPQSSQDGHDSEQPTTCGDTAPFQMIAERLAPVEGKSSTRGLSVELSSLFADGAPHPQTGDHIVLIVSDSEIGLRCASVVGAVLHRHVGGTYRRVDVGEVASLSAGLPCSDPAASFVDSEQLAGAITAAGVTVVVIEGLTADEEYAVEHSGPGIAHVLGSAYAAARTTGHRLMLHPVGGYKATIPLFTALASHLPTGHEIDIEMWSNHEQTPMGLRQPLQRIGVPDEEYWDLQDLSRIRTDGGIRSIDGRPVRLRSTRWNRYAWQSIDGGGYELTDVGRSIIELRAACTQEPAGPKGA